VRHHLKNAQSEAAFAFPSIGPLRSARFQPWFRRLARLRPDTHQVAPLSPSFTRAERRRRCRAPAACRRHVTRIRRIQATARWCLRVMYGRAVNRQNYTSLLIHQRVISVSVRSYSGRRCVHWP